MSTIGAIRTKAQALLQDDGKIDSADVAKILKEAGPDPKKLGAEEKAFLTQLLQHDNFDPKARALLADTLNVSKDKPKGSVVGTSLGTATGPGNTKLDVTVTRELSPPGGFTTENEAIAFARAANDPKATIYKGPDDRWHAVDTALPVKGLTAGKGISGLREVGAVDKDAYAAKLKLAKQAQATFKEVERSGGDATGARAARDEAYRAVVAEALGIPAKDINVLQKKGDAPVVGKFNFDPNLDSYGRAVEHKGEHATVISKGIVDLGEPSEVLNTAFHESTHIRHDERADALRDAHKASKTKDSFETWVDKQVGKKVAGSVVTPEDAWTSKNLVKGGKNTTETIAHLNGFMASYGTPRTPTSKGGIGDTLVNSDLAMSAKYANLAGLNTKSPKDPNFAMRKELASRLQAFHDGLDDAGKARFKVAIEKAKAENPGSYLDDVKYKK